MTGKIGERLLFDGKNSAVAALFQRFLRGGNFFRAQREGEALVDAAAGAVAVEVHGDDADARL